MAIDSPHLYVAASPGRPDSVLQAALQVARRMEAAGYTPVLSLKHLAVQSGVPYVYLRMVIKGRRHPYVEFARRKRRGGRLRPISAPEPVLMQVQRWILRHALPIRPTHVDSFAYTRGRSAADCARRHLGATWLIKFDLHNFFHSVREPDVYRCFRPAYEPLVAFELSRLCTRAGSPASLLEQRGGDQRYSAIESYSPAPQRHLPQGSPTSGVLANLCALDLDRRLSQLAEGTDLVYTRYSDDMTMSGRGAFSRTRAQELIPQVRRIVRSAGFLLHEKKTVVVPPGSRHIVLGTVLTPFGLRLTREFRARLEAHVRGVSVFGLAEHAKHRNFASVAAFLEHVAGMIAYSADVHPAYGLEIRARWEAALASTAAQNAGHSNLRRGSKLYPP